MLPLLLLGAASALAQPERALSPLEEAAFFEGERRLALFLGGGSPPRRAALPFVVLRGRAHGRHAWREQEGRLDCPTRPSLRLLAHEGLHRAMGLRRPPGPPTPTAFWLEEGLATWLTSGPHPMPGQITPTHEALLRLTYGDRIPLKARPPRLRMRELFDATPRALQARRDPQLQAMAYAQAEAVLALLAVLPDPEVPGQTLAQRGTILALQAPRLRPRQLILDTLRLGRADEKQVFETFREWQRTLGAPSAAPGLQASQRAAAIRRASDSFGLPE